MNHNLKQSPSVNIIANDSGANQVAVQENHEQQNQIPQNQSQSNLVHAASQKSGKSGPVSLPILKSVARGIWRSVNYTSRTHYVGEVSAEDVKHLLVEKNDQVQVAELHQDLRKQQQDPSGKLLAEAKEKDASK